MSSLNTMARLSLNFSGPPVSLQFAEDRGFGDMFRPLHQHATADTPDVSSALRVPFNKELEVVRSSCVVI
jgi:hypothetical protein